MSYLIERTFRTAWLGESLARARERLTVERAHEVLEQRCLTIRDRPLHSVVLLGGLRVLLMGRSASYAGPIPALLPGLSDRPNTRGTADIGSSGACSVVPPRTLMRLPVGAGPASLS